MEPENRNILQKIEEDDLLKKILSINPKGILNNSLTIAEQVQKLGKTIELLNNELQKQVLEKHGDLLQQANHATKLETVLNTMNIHVHNLFANAERLRTQIILPYNELEKHTIVLSRLHLACRILRQVNRLQQLSKRLTNTSDPIQKATIVYELENLATDPDLKDIEAVTTELRNIRSHQQKVVQLANGSLNQGVINENITQTTTALQIYINLGTIKITTDNFIEYSLHECQESWKSVFNITLTSSSKGKGGPNLISTQGFRNKFWVELDKVFSEDIYQICKRVAFLQNTLNNMNLPNMEIHIAPKFWKNLGKLLGEEINKSSAAVKQMLELDYPKLLKCHYEMTKKLRYEYFSFDRHVLGNLENAYLSTSLSRMLDPIHSIFNSDNCIASHDIIDSLIRVITSELSVGLIEDNLSEQISKNVAKCIKMFAVKTEQQLETGPDAAQVIGGAPNVGQHKNVNLANALNYLQNHTLRMLSNMKEILSDMCVSIINDSLKYLNDLTLAIMQPLVASINSVIETIIITIHLETDWSKLQVPPNKSYHSCSPYMRELTQFVTRVYHTYLEGFENKELLSIKCNEISHRTVELFVRHSSLLRPISRGGRLRLQSDYQHMENALKTISPQLPDLGRTYRLLKSMASLITLTPQDIMAGHVSGSSVPSSTILLMLFAFAEPDLASPHQNTSWSLPKLSAWLDEHPKESDRLDLVAGALQKYESYVRQSNSMNYDPVYPIMSQILEDAMKQIDE